MCRPGGESRLGALCQGCTQREQLDRSHVDRPIDHRAVVGDLDLCRVDAVLAAVTELARVADVALEVGEVAIVRLGTIDRNEIGGRGSVGDARAYSISALARVRIMRKLVVARLVRWTSGHAGSATARREPLAASLVFFLRVGGQAGPGQDGEAAVVDGLAGLFVESVFARGELGERAIDLG